MSPLKTPSENPAAAIPFRVRMEPYLVESICELCRLVRDKGNAHSDIGGLLFGKAEPGARTVEALKMFSDAGPHSELARRERMERAYSSTLQEAKSDPELSKFEVVGWFSFRNGSGLLSSDVLFHNQHFRRPEDLALIVWREGLSQVTAEFYSKSEQEVLTSEDYRWGSVRLSADIRHMRESIELAMRVKLAEDSYLRAYDTEGPESPFASIMRRAEEMTEKLLGLLHKQKDDNFAAKVRGYLGDGRLPSRLDWPPEAPPPEPASTPQPNFNSYLDAANAAAASASANPYSGWPGSAYGNGTAPAPTRAVEPQPEFRVPEPPVRERRPPLEFPPPSLDFGRLGQSPISGRSGPQEVSGLPALYRPPAPAKSLRSFPWPLAAGLFLACSGAVFAFLALGMQNEGGRFSQAFHTIFPGGDLNLRVRTDDDRLRLTWNQRNPAVLTATDGTLEILDGQQHRQVHLEGRQVADGSVLYRPLTNDVTFRLEVRGEQGGASGSVRVLDGLASQEQALDVSAPQLAANTPNARPSAATNGANSLAASSARDSSAPTLLRSDNAAQANPPMNDAPVTPFASSQRSAAHPYQTTETVGPLSTPSGSTINSWDTSARKPRSQPRSHQTPVLGSNGYVAPRPLMQVMPRTSGIPNGAIQSRTRVEVQVHVDPIGKVESAHVVGGVANETVASAALAAARQWTFQPASNNGRPVESDHTIVFEFRPQR